MTRLYRSTQDKKLAGICGGLGEIYNLDANIIRIALVILFVFSGFFPIGIIYLAAWVILPEDIALNDAER